MYGVDTTTKMARNFIKPNLTPTQALQHYTVYYVCIATVYKGNLNSIFQLEKHSLEQSLPCKPLDFSAW